MMLRAVKSPRFMFTVIITASLCIACDTSVDVSKSPMKNSQTKDPIVEEEVISPVETISIEALEQQLSPLHARILELESQLESIQQATASAMSKKEDERFEQSVMEQKISDLQNENQELSNQVAAQEETIQQLEDELSTMNAQYKEELAKQPTPPQNNWFTGPTLYLGIYNETLNELHDSEKPTITR